MNQSLPIIESIALKNDLRDAITALERALTQRPAAQEVDGPIAASLGDIVALWDQHAPSEYMTAIHMQAKRALAGQQPVSPDMARWCAYVGGMVAHWVKSDPDALARLGDDAFEAAIAGIIERRLWAMPKTAPQQATPAREAREAEQRARMQARLATRHEGKATADFDLPAPNDAPQQATPTTSGNILTDAFNEVQALKQQATTEPVGEPEHHRQAWAALTEACQRVAKTEGSAADLTRAIDRFSDVLMGDTRPAPGVPEGFALVPIKSDDAILRPFYNCPPDELGLAWDAAMRVAQVRLAAAQAKGGEHG